MRSAALGAVGALAAVVVTGAASDTPGLSSAILATVAVAAVVAAVIRHGRDLGSGWRRAWSLLAVGLVIVAVTAAAGPPTGAGTSATDLVRFCGVAVIAAGLVQLLHDRMSGRALDALLEGMMVAAAIGLAAWSLAGRDHGIAELVVLLLPMERVVVLWLAIRLIWMTPEHPPAYRFLVGAFVCLLTVDAAVAGAELGRGALSRDDLTALELWAYGLWALAALHPSLARSFEPVSPRASGLHRRHVAALFALMAAPPLAIAIAGLSGDAPSLAVALVSTVTVPALEMVYLVRQVDDRAKAEYRAQHDALTGLPNRTLFHDRVEVALAQANRSGTRAAVMFLDLDRFKSINDSLGHAVGNQLLNAVAKRLRGSMREVDTVARIGGDEFTILLPVVGGPDDCVTVAEKILKAFAEPFVAGTRELTASTSIGIALYPDDGDDVDALLKNADTAMYRAKARGRNIHQLYSADMSARARLKLSLENNLRVAIDRGQLDVHYQPKVDLVTNEVVGLEALVRWPHRSLGFVAPTAFIPLAEETGLIMPLGEWVLDAVCRQIREWLDGGFDSPPVAVNLSARQFTDRGFKRKIQEALERTGVPPELLELEITESVFMQDLAATSATLHELRAMGIRCSIDDFGTGYSGLTYLAQMPIDSLKIDQSFIRKIEAGIDEASIVNAVIALAHSLRMKVVAEGVETDLQATFLRDRGCEEMQGFLFSPALPAYELQRLVMSSGPLAVPGATSVPVEGQVRVSADRRVTALLSAVGGNGDLIDVDDEVVANVLRALQLGEPTVAGTSPTRSTSLRIAAGTFAGLMPLSGGLAAAGALPAPVQHATVSAFDQIGVALPDVERPAPVPHRRATPLRATPPPTLATPPAVPAAVGTAAGADPATPPQHPAHPTTPAQPTAPVAATPRPAPPATPGRTERSERPATPAAPATPPGSPGQQSLPAQPPAEPGNDPATPSTPETPAPPAQPPSEPGNRGGAATPPTDDRADPPAAEDHTGSTPTPRTGARGK